jgi:glycosyltransferase involved in cell wall biosynthesis
MEGYNKRSLTVLMTTDTVGGVWTYCIELCKALEAYNVSFHLATLGAPLQQWQTDEVNDLDNVHVHTSQYKLEWMCEPWEDVEAAGNWLLHLEREIQPDIIHLNSYCFGSLAFKAPKIVVAHSDVFSWWQAVRKTEVPDEWNEFYRRTKEGLDRADLIIAPSQAMMQTILDNYKTLNRKKVIYNAREFRTSTEINKQPLVLSAGRVWDEAKNIKLFVKAAENIQWKVQIAGDAEFSNNRTEVTSANVEYLGKLSASQVVDQLQKASIYVLPAKYEPFGLSILEAAKCGCALVLGDISSLKEIWGDAALYVDTEDAAQLSEVVNMLIADDNLRDYYQAKAKQRAERFNIKAFAKQYLNTYYMLQPKQKVTQLKQEVAL